MSILHVNKEGSDILTVGIETEKPIFLLLVCGDVTAMDGMSINMNGYIDLERSSDITVVVHCVPYTSANSSRNIWTFCPFGVLCVTK